MRTVRTRAIVYAIMNSPQTVRIHHSADPTDDMPAALLKHVGQARDVLVDTHATVQVIAFIARCVAYAITGHLMLWSAWVIAGLVAGSSLADMLPWAIYGLSPQAVLMPAEFFLGMALNYHILRLPELAAAFVFDVREDPDSQAILERVRVVSRGPSGTYRLDAPVRPGPVTAAEILTASNRTAAASDVAALVPNVRLEQVVNTVRHGSEYCATIQYRLMSGQDLVSSHDDPDVAAVACVHHAFDKIREIGAANREVPVRSGAATLTVASGDDTV